MADKGPKSAGRLDQSSTDEQLFEAARSGNIAKLKSLLDAHPDRLLARDKPYEHTLLHVAAANGHLPVVDFLLQRGIDPNVREKGDNTYPMHWAAAAGHLNVIKRLADAGGDVIGHGDDHALEVIGWATGWDGCNDATHRDIADFLVSRGARHHIYSAISLGSEQLVRSVVAEHPSELSRPQSHNENFRLPLHFAVHKRLPRMVELLIELGADPVATDASSYTASAYAESPEIDRAVLEAKRDRIGPTLLTALGLDDWQTAERLWTTTAASRDGLLHLMAKRNNIQAMHWLLEHGVDPDSLWDHWGAMVTPLHLAALGGHPEAARMLLTAGADPTIRDTQHNSDALGWARFFLEHTGSQSDERQRREELVRVIEQQTRAN